MIDFEVLQTALTNMVERTIAYLPRLVTTILILLLGWLIARVVSSIVRQIAERLRLDSLLQRTGITAGLQRAQIDRSGPELLAIFLYWIIFLNFLLIGLENMGLEAAVEPLRNLIAFLPRLLASLVTLTAGVLLAQFLGRATQAAMAGMGVEFNQEIGQGVNALLVIMVVIVVLEQIGIDASIMSNIVINVLTIVVAGLALAFGLGGRDVARNVLAGYYAREQFNTGETLVIDGEEGVLEAIGTLNAEIRLAGERLVVPNVQLTETAVRVRREKVEE